MKTLHPLIVILANLLLLTSTAAAQTAEDYHPFLSDQFNIDLGVFVPDINLDLRVNGRNIDNEVDFDEAVNFNSNQSAGSINFRWRFGEKWSFWGQYWQTNTSSSAVLTEEIEWEDFVFKAGTSARGGLDVKVARIFFGREFSSGLKHEFGLGAGLHWMEVGAFLEGEIIIDDDSTGFQRANVGAAFPMPNFGAWYMYSWSPKWVFQSRLDWLSVSIDEYSGGLWDAQAGINYQLFRNVGVGLYYKGFILDGDVDKSDWRGSIKLEPAGPLVTLTATW